MGGISWFDGDNRDRSCSAFMGHTILLVGSWNIGSRGDRHGLCGNDDHECNQADRGVTDTGTLVQGHAGVLDQIDNICFAAPVFYHLTRFFWSI